MTTLLIAISGCSGGNKGPLEVYSRLQSHWDTKEVRVLQLETIPDSVIENIELVVKTVLDQPTSSYKDVFLVGYSMGGAVALGAAASLLEKQICKVKGIALLSTQTDGLQVLTTLNLPILFYHGSRDEFFQPSEIKRFYNKYEGPKKMVIVSKGGHNLGPKYAASPYGKALARNIADDIKGLFRATKETSPNEPQTKIIPRTLRESTANAFYSAISRIHPD